MCILKRRALCRILSVVLVEPEMAPTHPVEELLDRAISKAVVK